MNRVAILASGSGTNALRLIEESLVLPNVEIACVIVDKSSSPLPGILKERFPFVPVSMVLSRMDFPLSERKADFERRLVESLQSHDVQWIFLAGFMRILGAQTLSQFKRIINIHPSLLPAYPGMHSYERAFADGVNQSGVTIHWVDEGLDTGPIIKQVSFPRLVSDSLDDFINRGKNIEWQIYPELLRELNERSSISGVSYES